MMNKDNATINYCQIQNGSTSIRVPIIIDAEQCQKWASE